MLILIFLILHLVNSADFNKEFTSSYESYQIQNPPEKDIFINENELFKRDKCTTCCRVVFVSDYNFDQNKPFEESDKEERYALDMEFDDKRSIRLAEGSYEQCILLRPLNINNELQHFELNSYKMINMFASPKRVHDIRGGISKGNKLIIWKKKEPLLTSTNNQRFVYTYPYKSHYFNDDVYKNYPKHFYAPYYTSEPVCYEAHIGNQQTWTGNKNLKVLSKNYQIKINSCSNDAKQIFLPIFV